ncbi:MAG TPA: hypothetical protein PKI03_16965 [Pseudomonadota bacterium]|nr:hypothetical protein [Pseudomonadota bacterium]
MRIKPLLIIAAAASLTACPDSNPPPTNTPAQNVAPANTGANTGANAGANAVATTLVKPQIDLNSLGTYPDSIQRSLDWKANPPDLPPPPPSKTEKVGELTTTTYSLGAYIWVDPLYPSKASLPDTYWSYYPDILQTIRSFTLQSAVRDGFSDAQVKVSRGGTFDLFYLVTIASSNPAIEGYKTVHPDFISKAIASTDGSKKCQACALCGSCSLCTTPTDPKCWDPAPKSGQPWAMYLPLGLPMLTQKTTLFLDYPPLTALTGKNPDGSYGDYLSNYTMCRWGRVLDAAGASNPYAYETIVDSRPVAAPGSGQDAHLPVPQATYNNASTGGLYLNPMLQLLTNPLGSLATGTLPVAVFGSTARQAWGKIIGSPTTPGILAVGTTNIGGQKQSTAWISTNHPDVTAYNCCAGDSTCSSSSQALVADEQIDFVTACWMQAMAANPTLDPNTAKTQCAAQWQPPTAGNNALTQCIQEKLDNNNQKAVCCSWQDAWAYCTQYKNNACATLDCKFSAEIRSRAPATPPWQQNTCNTYRFFPGSAYCTRCGGCTSSTKTARVLMSVPDGPGEGEAEAATPAGPAPAAAPAAPAPAPAKPTAKPTAKPAH